MRIITYPEWLGGAGFANPRLKVLRQRRHVVGAFGRREAWANLDYVELDCVAPCLADDLTPIFERDLAVNLVALYFAEWAVAVAHADQSNAPIFLCLIEYGEPGKPSGPKSHFVGVSTTGDPEQLTFDASLKPETHGLEPERVAAVNVSRILARVRDNARRAGFDFSERFLPAPDDPLLADILAPYREARDAALAKHAEKQKQKGRDDRSRRAGILARAAMEARI